MKKYVAIAKVNIMNENEIKKYSSLLKKCSLLKNIPEDSYGQVLEYLRATKKFFRKGEIILQIGDEFLYAGLVLEGTVECSYQDEDFNKFNMNHFSAGDLFGESMACADISQSPMQVAAVTNCEILFLDYGVLCDAKTESEFQNILAANLIRNFSKRNFFLNQKVRILSQKNLRQRILFYLRTLKSDEKGTRKIPFSKTAMAEFLCVNRAALSRELSHMVQEKILKMDGRKFVIL